jgi:arylsulfatase
LISLGLLSGCGADRPPEAPDRSPGDVLLITVDTLRADHMGLYGYARDTTPELDAFFADGRVIERAYSTEANTSPSVVSILSGMLPQQHRVRLLYQLLRDEVPLIPDLLPPEYQSAAFVANVVLTDEAIGMASRFDHYDDYLEEDVGEPGAVLYERNAARTTDAALRWLRVGRDPERPLFLWIHYIDPHAPYRAPDREAGAFDHPQPRPIDTRLLAGSVREQGVDDGLAYLDRYDEEIAYTDREVGRLLAGYAKMRPIDEALVVFTADHGESMMEHEVFFAHGYHVYEEIVRVPLMFRGPGVEPGRVDWPGSGIDVAPTILAFAGGAPQTQLEGVDWRAPGSRPAERSVYAEATSPLMLLAGGGDEPAVGYWRAAIRRGAKWVLGLAQGERTVLERRYYDLAEDPAELAPRPPQAGAGGGDAELRALIEADPDPGGLPAQLRRGIQIDAPKVAPRATEAQREQLRALGYVE